MNGWPDDIVAVTLLLHLARRRLELAEFDLRAEGLTGRADQLASTVALIRSEIGDQPPAS